MCPTPHTLFVARQQHSNDTPSRLREKESKTRSSDDKHDFGRAGSKVELRDKLKNTGIQAEPHLWNMVAG